MELNYIAIFVAALVPMLIGFIWYNPKVMGTSWMIEVGLTEDKMKGANMPLIFGLSFIFALMLSLSMNLLVIHQMHFGSMLMNHQAEMKDPNSVVGSLYKSVMDTYGSEFRTFKHGAFHGLLSSIFIILPVMATNAMFERKSWKLIFINWGYWAITFCIMGGIIGAWQ